MYDDSVSGGEVDAESAGFGRDEKNADIEVCVELVDELQTRVRNLAKFSGAGAARRASISKFPALGAARRVRIFKFSGAGAARRAKISKSLENANFCITYVC